MHNKIEDAETHRKTGWLTVLIFLEKADQGPELMSESPIHQQRL
jgi:hypothetical protein